MIKRKCKNLFRLYTGEIACLTKGHYWDKECKDCKDTFVEANGLENELEM